LCAGGDVQSLYRLGQSGDYDKARQFFWTEYRLNEAISRFKKPYVAIMDGVVMGGGVGVSAHGSHRIVTERTMVAMPECAIGLIPDVGGTFLLSRAPGRVGEYLGLTGTRCGAADTIYAGMADVFVPSEKIAGLVDRLCETGNVSAIARVASEPPASTLRAAEPWIDRAFSAETPSAIIEALGREATPEADKAKTAILRASPLSAHCTLAALRRVRDLPDLKAALAIEYRYTARALEQSDFPEGVRSLLIDKDKSPRWRHAALDAVTNDEVEALLGPFADEREELWGTR
jgi:enoyl-CoA hydratase/carnithine racemase